LCTGIKAATAQAHVAFMLEADIRKAASKHHLTMNGSAQPG